MNSQKTHVKKESKAADKSKEKKVHSYNFRIVWRCDSYSIAFFGDAFNRFG